MKSLVSTTANRVKTVEVKMSNMTFVVTCSSHYLAALNNPHWTTPVFVAHIKETGEKISPMCGKRFIKQQMELINSKPHLFLN